MTLPMIIALAVTVLMIILIMVDKLPFGAPPLLALLLLVVFGVTDIKSAFGGFANPTIVMLASFMAIIAALQKTSFIVKFKQTMFNMASKGGFKAYVLLILIVMLVVISVFIIANTIKLSTFTRREEIAIMKMCGATNWFVRAPFLVEGVILGGNARPDMIAELQNRDLAVFCQWGIYGLITRAMMESGIFSIITTVPFGNISHVVLLVFLLVGFAIGGGGSVMAIRKFLKV